MTYDDKLNVFRFFCLKRHIILFSLQLFSCAYFSYSDFDALMPAFVYISLL